MKAVEGTCKLHMYTAIIIFERNQTNSVPISHTILITWSMRGIQKRHDTKAHRNYYIYVYESFINLYIISVAKYSKKLNITFCPIVKIFKSAFKNIILICTDTIL